MTIILEDVKETVNTLNEIAQLEIDDAHAYNQAISNIEDLRLKDSFLTFKVDCERHIGETSQLIQELGGEPPEYSRDFKGYLITGYTAIRSMMGTKGALEAMHTNEKLTVRRYEDALQKNITPTAKGLLAKNLMDARRHLNFIESSIAAIS